MYERIVVPLDGSELAERAVPHAGRLARLTGSPIHLLRVVDVTQLQGYGPYPLVSAYAGYEEPLAMDEQAGREYLAGIERGLVDRGLTVTQEVRRGLVRQEITAATRPGDLIVMASHGRGGLPRWFLGSVAEEVVRHAAVPVLLVRVAATAPVREAEPQPVSAGAAAAAG